MENEFLKIINTTYSLLDFFPESEPLKIKAKERVLAILENLTIVFGMEGWASLKKEKAALQLRDDIEVLENYLSLGKLLGFIDGINFLIITKQYKEIKEKIDLPVQAVRQELEMIPVSNETTQKVILPVAPEKKLISSESSATKEFSERKAPLAAGFSPRQEKIIKIVSGRQKTQVADIIKELPNITKRTIRRDLDDLLKKGKISRFGEWNQVFYQVKG